MKSNYTGKKFCISSGVLKQNYKISYTTTYSFIIIKSCAGCNYAFSTPQFTIKGRRVSYYIYILLYISYFIYTSFVFHVLISCAENCAQLIGYCPSLYTFTLISHGPNDRLISGLKKAIWIHSHLCVHHKKKHSIVTLWTYQSRYYE